MPGKLYPRPPALQFRDSINAVCSDRAPLTLTLSSRRKRGPIASRDERLREGSLVAAPCGSPLSRGRQIWRAGMPQGQVRGLVPDFADTIYTAPPADALLGDRSTVGQRTLTPFI